MFMEEKAHVVKISVLPNLINALPVKVRASYFVVIDKLILKFTQRGKRPRVANITQKKNKVGGLALYNLKSCYNATLSNNKVLVKE